MQNNSQIYSSVIIILPLINKPTRETNHTATVIDNIFAMFLRRYIYIYLMWAYSVHILVITMLFSCVMNSEKRKQNQHSYVKRNFTNKSTTYFIRCLNKIMWDTIYHCDSQTAFTRFQDLLNLNFDKSL